MNEEEFRRVAKEKGYGEVEFLEIEPGPEEEMHSHEHSVLSFVLTGEFTMTTNEWTKALLPGDIVNTHSLRPGLQSSCLINKDNP